MRKLDPHALLSTLWLFILLNIIFFCAFATSSWIAGRWPADLSIPARP